MMKAHVARLIAKRALRGAEDLSAVERIELYEGVAEFLPEPEANEARLAAFAIKECERQQMKFLGLFAAGAAARTPGGDGSLGPNQRGHSNT